MLSGRFVKLRAIEDADLPHIAAWRSDPRVYEFFYEYEPLSLAQQKDWHEGQRRNRSERNWVIALHSGEPIGTISIYGIDARSRRAEWGRFLIGSERYIGVGAEVEALVLQYAFEHLNLNCLYCEVLSDNAAVIRQHEQFGFRIDGQLRARTFKNGRFVDAVMMSLLADEYSRAKASHPYAGIFDQIRRFRERQTARAAAAQERAEK